MNRSAKTILLATFVAGSAALLPAAASAQGVLYYEPPPHWAPGGMNVMVANVNGIPHVIWKPFFNESLCMPVAIGDANGLFGNTHIHGSDNRDHVTVNYSGTGTFCSGVDYGPLTVGGFYLDVHSLGGNDSLTAGPGDTWLWGGGGDDFAQSYAPFGQIIGHDGNDHLHSRASNPAGQGLQGGPGDDCLGVEAAGAPAIFDCGDGFDRVLDVFSHAVSCERGPLNHCGE